MTALWVVPFVWLLGGKENRRRLRYIMQARAWYRNNMEGLAEMREYFDELKLHRDGNCSNYAWCIRNRLNPEWDWAVPPPEYLKLSEVTQGWFMATAPAEQWAAPAWIEPLSDVIPGRTLAA